MEKYLKIGGIYTTASETIIILDRRNNYYFTIKFEDTFTIRDSVLHTLKINKNEHIKQIHICKFNDNLLNFIDGYLGQLPKDIIIEWYQILKKKGFYNE